MSEVDCNIFRLIRQSLTSDSFILDNVKGLHFPFDHTIEQKFIPPAMKYSESDIAKMNRVIDKFVASYIIEEVNHCQDEYISY